MAEYDSIAKEYEKATVREFRKFCYDPLLEKHIGNLEGKRVLDLACGEGFSSRFMKKLGANEIIGLDISSELIEIAKKKDSENIQYFVGDAINYDFSVLGKFDVITAIMLFDYVSSKEDFLKILKKINSVLNEDGEFYFLNPNPKTQLNYNSYGVKQVAESDKEGSKVIVTLGDFYGKKHCTFTTYYWKNETIQNLFKEARFDFELLPSIIAKEGIEKYGKAFWKEYQETPMYIMIKAKK